MNGVLPATIEGVRSKQEELLLFLQGGNLRDVTWEQLWGGKVCGIKERLFARPDGKDIFHGSGDDVKGEVG